MAVPVEHWVERFPRGHAPWDVEITAFNWDAALIRQSQPLHVLEDRRETKRDEASRRKAERLTIYSDINLYFSATKSLEGQLIDVSTHGCCLVIDVNRFVTGDKISLKIDRLERWHGTVRWLNRHRMGVQFDLPFYPAVVDHLVQSKKEQQLKLGDHRLDFERW